MDIECNKCGDCCRVIIITQTKEELSNNNGEDAKWIKEHFFDLSQEEATRLNPQLAKENYLEYFGCDVFKDNTCIAYEQRPRMCRDFPFYNNNENNYKLDKWPMCSFREEIDPTYNNCTNTLIRITV